MYLENIIYKYLNHISWLLCLAIATNGAVINCQGGQHTSSPKISAIIISKNEMYFLNILTDVSLYKVEFGRLLLKATGMLI